MKQSACVTSRAVWLLSAEMQESERLWLVRSMQRIFLLRRYMLPLILVSLNAFLKLMCRTQKITASGRKDEMWMRLSDSFAGERKVIIIDEAQHLPIKTIEAIRAFFDSNPTLGICLVGNIETVTNTGRSKEAFAQIRNRTKLTEIRHTTSITANDIALLFPPVADDEKAKGLLLGISRSEQGIRGASNVFSNAVDNGNITYDGLLAMAKAMKINVYGGI